MCAVALDGTRLDVSGNSQVSRVGAIPHGLQFLNGDVIAFVCPDAGDGQVQDGADNDNRGNCNANSNRVFLYRTSPAINIWTTFQYAPKFKKMNSDSARQKRSASHHAV